MSMLDELKERNTLELILIVRFAYATLDVGHPILRAGSELIERGSCLLARCISAISSPRHPSEKRGTRTKSQSSRRTSSRTSRGHADIMLLDRSYNADLDRTIFVFIDLLLRFIRGRAELLHI
jgi:hypothetical protein